MSKKTGTIWTPAEREAWKLPEDITVSRWAAMNRMLPAGSPFPGLYKLHLTPYMAGPQDAFCDDEVEEITMMFPSQVSKSCSAQNMVGFIIDQCSGETFYVVPREKDVDYVTEKVFKPMVELSEALSRHTSGSPRDLQGDHFDFDRMTLYFGWAGSPAELAAKYIKYLFLDETDKYPPFAGREANPIDLAVKRTTTFWDRKIIKISTPVRKENYIFNSYNSSNMQKFYIPCPHCGEYSNWGKFIQLKISPKLRDPDEIIKEGTGCVWYECEFCANKIEEDKKTELVAKGLWLPEGQTIDANGNTQGLPLRSKRHSGFNAPAWIAPFDGVSWPRIMAKWFKANTEVGIALGELLDFHNSIEGVPFEETGKQIKASELQKLKGGFAKGTVPDDCIVLVASADYHKSRTRGIVRIDYEVRGFGYGLKNYVITSGTTASFEQLDKEVLLSPFPWAGPASPEKPQLAVMALFVDSGYEPDDVYEYCRQRPGLTIPIKGEPGPCLKPLRPSELESATERRLTARQRRRYRGMQLLIVDTYYFKNQVMSWAEPRLDEAGKIIAQPLTYFYNEIPSYYFTEFSNERKIKVRDTKGNVKWIWKPVTTGAPTHSLDTAVYAAAAGFYKGVHYLKRPGEQKRAPAAGQKKKIRLSELQWQKRMR